MVTLLPVPGGPCTKGSCEDFVLVVQILPQHITTLNCSGFKLVMIGNVDTE